MRYETEHKGRKVGLEVECGCRNGRRGPDCADYHGNNGKRFLTTEEVEEEMIALHAFFPNMRAIEMSTHKGQSVTVKAI